MKAYEFWVALDAQGRKALLLVPDDMEQEDTVVDGATALCSVGPGQELTRRWGERAGWFPPYPEPAWTWRLLEGGAR